MIQGEKLSEFGKLAEELNLPTTPQIARESRDEFINLASLIPWRLRRELDSDDLHSAVYGFDSIRTIYMEYGPQLMERAFNHTSSQFRIVRERGTDCYASVINLRSAQRIIYLNPDIFPEAHTNPGRWMTENANKLSSKQIGLLSGFPRGSVLDFDIWTKFINNKKKRTYNGPKLFHDQWLLEAGEISTAQFEERVKKGLARRFTAGEIEKLINACRIRANTIIDLGAVLFTEEDVKLRCISLQFMQYLQTHPDFTLENVLGTNEEQICTISELE